MPVIRNYRDEDAALLWQLFFNTIRTINRRDYTQAQVQAWAISDQDPALWLQRMQGLKPFVAEIDEQIVGYTDLQDNGLIDHFFCHHEHQGKGVGKALMQHVFAQADNRGISKLHSHVSITAKPFYLHFGFVLLEQQQMAVRGQVLENYLVEKTLVTSKSHN